MPRQARLDAPGTLHHVIGRGIEGAKIFRTPGDRQDFLTRLGVLSEAGAWQVYAWALLDNHFHLLLRTGTQSLAESMRRLLTGYVVNFNLRYRRHGHLFQNRYKSIVVEEEPYLLELTRYIHLNPLRAGVVPNMKELRRYPWTGHASLMGQRPRPWQDVGTILSHFGKRKRDARLRYERFVAEGLPSGRRPELVGGGLIRSLGGWSQVISLQRTGERSAADARILGSGDFVEQMLAQAEARVKATLGWRGRIPTLAVLADKIARGQGVEPARLRSRDRKQDAVRARRMLCQVAVKRLGYSGAAVARFLGVTTSLVNRMASADDVAGVNRYLR
jgi:REP element-mobilizing transposase RayT